ELSANDMFLNLHDTDPSSDRCTDITVKKSSPGWRLFLGYRLSLPLPYAVDEEKGNAKWDKLRGCLSVTLPMIRDVKWDLPLCCEYEGDSFKAYFAEPAEGFRRMGPIMPALPGKYASGALSVA
ncbi:hypothetical protein FOZ62_023279, partial [Perkinsus olseni]